MCIERTIYTLTNRDPDIVDGIGIPELLPGVIECELLEDKGRDERLKVRLELAPS